MEQLLRPGEVAAALHLSRSKVYQLIQDGEIPAVRIVGSVRVPESALGRWIEENTVLPVPVEKVAV